MKAVLYLRTSSAANVGPDKDSDDRQRATCSAYAAANGFDIVAEFYDAAVSGADPVEDRPGFTELMTYIGEHDISTIIVESPDRFARDLRVQMDGHDALVELDITLIPTTCPDHFTDDTPTAILVRQILGAVAEFEKRSIVLKLRAARDRKSAKLGRRIEGVAPVPDDVKAFARELRKIGKHTLREVSRRLAEQGHLATSGRPYDPKTVSRMLA